MQRDLLYSWDRIEQGLGWQGDPDSEITETEKLWLSQAEPELETGCELQGKDFEVGNPEAGKGFWAQAGALEADLRLRGQECAASCDLHQHSLLVSLLSPAHQPHQSLGKIPRFLHKRWVLC